MRTLNELTKESQARIRQYVYSNSTVKSTDLADDLNLRETTIRAMKAHFTRRTVSNFNDMLAQ